MIELKLLNNHEIKNKKERQKYKKKFVQYTNATNACLSVFWVFDVHKGGSIVDFDNLKTEYRNLDNTLVLLTDCRCSSGIETGIPQVKNNIGSKKARGNKTRSKINRGLNLESAIRLQLYCIHEIKVAIVITSKMFSN